MFKNLILLIILSFIMFSCTDDNMSFDIGKDEIDVRTKMAVIDTFTVKSYTVMLDSIPTSAVSDPAIIVGTLQDNIFGTINASSFFRVIPPEAITSSTSSHSYAIQDDAVFDSLKFYIVYNKYYEGDTSLPYRLDLHRLSSELKPNTDGFFYNNDSIAAFPEHSFSEFRRHGLDNH
jgi:hypothetical protein